MCSAWVELRTAELRCRDLLAMAARDGLGRNGSGMAGVAHRLRLRLTRHVDLTPVVQTEAGKGTEAEPTAWCTRLATTPTEACYCLCAADPNYPLTPERERRCWTGCDTWAGDDWSG